MRVEGYVQIVPIWDRRNYKAPTVKSLRFGSLTKTAPHKPEPGAMVLKVSFDVPVEAFNISTINLEIEGDMQSVKGAVVPVPVEEDDE